MALQHRPEGGRIRAARRLAGLAGIFVALAVFLGLSSPVALAKPIKATLVVDAETGEILVASNADASTYPASLTKMMTLYLVFEALADRRLKPEDKLVFSANAAQEPATNVNVKRGETILVETAILALIVRSANDVATAFAERLGGSEAVFAQMMTRKARELGMMGTTFRNAHGLPDPGQRTTARDMATLGIALIRDFPGYYGYFDRSSFKFRGHTYGGHNGVLRKFKGADGIKTGYIRASGFNLVSSAERNGRRLVGVVLGGQSPSARDRLMVDLLTRGFATYRGNGQMLLATAPNSGHPFAEPAPIGALALDTAAGVGAPIPVTNWQANDEMAALIASVGDASSLTPVLKPSTRPSAAQMLTSAVMNQAGQLVAVSPISLAPVSQPGNTASGSGDVSTLAPDGQSVAPVWRDGPSAYGIQVGAYSRYNPAEAAAQRATKAIPQLLADARIVVDQEIKGDGHGLYRARVLGLSKQAAEIACANLKAKATDCLVLKSDSSLAFGAQ
jgi:D-alanyl-D-alanine carboxypeptidase